DFGPDPAHRAVELGLPRVGPADQETGGRAVLLRYRRPLRPQVLAGFRPVVPPEELLPSFQARLDRSRGPLGTGRREEDGEAPGRDPSARPQGTFPSGAMKMSSQLATWARKARRPLREHVRSWFIRVGVSRRSSSPVSVSTA